MNHLQKLYDLHMECENWAEAAFTLDKQAGLYNIDITHSPLLSICTSNS